MTLGSIGEMLAIPLNDPRLQVRVIALLKKKEAGPFAFLQSMRSGILKRIHPDPEKTETAIAYRREERRYQQLLASMVPPEFDAVISPPSRMAWQAEPYRQAIRKKNPFAIDLTPQLTRAGNVFAGENATVTELATHMRYVATGHECNIRRLIIVDDTFVRGTTATMIVEVLRAHGLPEDCQIVVACPLWLDTFSPKADDVIKEGD